MKAYLIASITLLMLPAVVEAQHVSVHYDRSVDFGKFKTYSWIKGTDANQARRAAGSSSQRTPYAVHWSL